MLHIIPVENTTAGDIESIIFSNDDKLLLIGCKTKIIIYNISTETGNIKEEYKLIPHSLENIRDVIISRDNTKMAATGINKLQIWDLTQINNPQPLQYKQTSIIQIKFIQDINDITNIIFIQCLYGIFIMNVNEYLKNPGNHNDNIIRKLINDHSREFTITNDYKFIIYEDCKNKTINIWNIQLNKCIKTINHKQNYLQNITLNHENTHIISTGHDQTMKIWELKTGRLLEILKYEDIIDKLSIIEQENTIPVYVTTNTFGPPRIYFSNSNIPNVIKTLNAKTNNNNLKKLLYF